MKKRKMAAGKNISKGGQTHAEAIARTPLSVARTPLRLIRAAAANAFKQNYQ